MSAILVGGMDRLRREYITLADSLGIRLKVFCGQERSIEKQLGGADALILCTAKVSHSARREVFKHSDARNVPVFQMHSAGLNSLRCCLEQCCRVRLSCGNCACCK